VGAVQGTVLRRAEHKFEAVEKIRSQEKQDKTVTLLYSCRDDEHNIAAALKEYLERRSAKIP